MTIRFVGYYSLFLVIEIAVCHSANTTLYVANGSTARMVCPLVNDSISWTGPPDRHLLASGEMADTDDYLVIRNRTHFTLEVKLFTEKDEGTYVCETVKENYIFLVRMITPPSNMTIDNEAADGCIHVYLNHEINLTCRVVSGTPQGTMVWKNNKMVVRKSHSSSVTYSFQPSAADDLAEFSCVANNSLILQRNIKICLNRPPKLQITPSPTIAEGTHVKLKCIHRLQNVIKTISWKYDDTNISNWSNLKQVELESITRSQAGKYSCTVEHQHWTASVNATIVVLYQPDVSITYNDENRELTCTAVGVPNHYDFSYWEHKTELGVFLRLLPSTRNGSLSIPYINNESDRHFDRGIYVCNVSNNVSVNGNKYVLSEYWLNSTGKPYFVTTNKVKQYGIIKQETNISVDIVSFTTPVDAALFTDGSFLSSNIKIVELRVKDTVYAKEVFVHGIRLIFTIHIQYIADFRSYTVVVNNTHGPANYTINLSSASRPDPPFSLHCIPRKHEITVSWKPGFNGGYRQQFFVEYNSRQEPFWKVLNASDYQSNTTTTVVTNLAPGTKYFIRMFSKNKINSSDHTEQCMVETESEGQFVVILVLIVILTALISVCCLVYQYKTGKLKDMRNSSCIRFIQVIRADGIGGVENDMYEMQNNIQPQQQPRDDTPNVQVYSSIDRRHQLSIGSTVSYSVTKNKKPNPLGPRKEQKGNELKKKNHCKISTSDENEKQDLNYIEVCFDQTPKDYPFKIHGLEQKTDYIDVDFTQKVCQPPDNDKDDISDDGFASAEVLKSMKRKTKNLNLQMRDF